MSDARAAKAALAAAKKRGKTTTVVERTAASIPENAAPQAAIERVIRGLAALRQPWFMQLIMEDPDIREAYYEAVASTPLTAKRK
jgi:hypothetical protein